MCALIVAGAAAWLQSGTTPRLQGGALFAKKASKRNAPTIKGPDGELIQRLPTKDDPKTRKEMRAKKWAAATILGVEAGKALDSEDPGRGSYPRVLTGAPAPAAEEAEPEAAAEAEPEAAAEPEPEAAAEAPAEAPAAEPEAAAEEPAAE